jgi:hypothetical protein
VAGDGRRDPRRRTLPAPGIAVMIAGVIVICGLITTALLLGTNPDTFHDRLGSFDR